MADRAEEDGIHAPELFEHRDRERLAGAQVPLAAEVIGNGLDAEPAGDRAEDLQGLGDDLRAGPVAGDDRDAVGARHQSILQSAWTGSFAGTATLTSPFPSTICRFTHGIRPPA